MIALQIRDVKDFMGKLLLQQTFDAFLVIEGSVTTYNTFLIDGRLHHDYYTKEEQEELALAKRRFSRWQELRPFCLELIKGKRTPLAFRFCFRLSPENTEKLLVQTGSAFSLSDVGSLHLNIRYDSAGLVLTTAASLTLFTMDKSLEQAWDKMVRQFLAQKEIAFELL